MEPRISHHSRHRPRSAVTPSGTQNCFANEWLGGVRIRPLLPGDGTSITLRVRQDPARLLFVFAEGNSHAGPVKALAPEIQVSRIGVNEDWRRGIKVKLPQ
jgi:hypothetical protein